MPEGNPKGATTCLLPDSADKSVIFNPEHAPGPILTYMDDADCAFSGARGTNLIVSRARRPRKRGQDARDTLGEPDTEFVARLEIAASLAPEGQAPSNDRARLK